MSGPTHLDLFSGIGGFALAARWAGFRTVGFCEIEPFAHRVLAKDFGAVMANSEGEQDRRQKQRRIQPDAGAGSPRIFGDIRTLDGKQFAGIDLLTGGFPCQPFSCAGKRRGTADDRHLWPEMLRVIAEAKPAWVLGENVAGFISMAQFDRELEVGADGSAEGEIGDVVHRVGRGIADEAMEALESLGYSVRPFLVPACAVDAKHRRMRVWIVAHDDGSQRGASRAREAKGWPANIAEPRSASALLADGLRHGSTAGPADSARWEEGLAGEPDDSRADVGNTASAGGCGRERREAGSVGDARRTGQISRSDTERGAGWLPEPDVGRVAHGIPARVDRLRGLGNAIVPQVAFEILRAIKTFCD